jgi:hypothetical protein
MRRPHLLALATFLTGVLVAGCGGSTPGATTSTRSVTTRSAGAHPTSPSGSHAEALLKFSRCMRANGVSNFPDPSPGGQGFPVPTGASPSSPAFRAAQARCQKLVLGGGPPGPGSTTHPSAQTMTKLLRIAVCMRQHGVAQFPDPQTTVPSNPAGIREITDFDGAILLFPGTIDMEAPAYRQALTACGAPPLGLPH